MTSSDQSRTRGAGQLCALMALMLLVPFGLRALNARFAPQEVPESYLPALEGPRVRGPFESEPIEQLAELKPGYVVIGDSMAGTRMHTTRLAELTGRPAAPLLQAGSGSVYWYLAFKNWVIASGERPKVVFIFFRDTNLTDVLFRLDEGFRWNIDRVAAAGEPELNAAIAARTGALRYTVRSRVDRTYGADQARLWMLPALPDRLARAMLPSRRERTAFIRDMNARFDFMHVRPFEAADLAQAVDREADFDAYVDRSVLPLMLRDAEAAGITLCFVRVQRRPVNNRPPEQSGALREYIAALRNYIEARGGIFHDDTGDPNLPLEMYDDGDHVKEDWRPRYTENLYGRLRAHPVIFHSLDFIGFFLAVTALYWMLPHRAQNTLLLGASYLFYGYIHPWFLILIAASTIVDFYAARGMDRWPDRRKPLLWLSIVSNLGMLAFFKYFDFFIQNVTTLLTGAGWETNPVLLRILLPVGISFYTFQTLSYTIDVYRGQLHARSSLLDFSVFVSLFPQLVAGPIVRASYLLPQVEAPRRFSANAARTGLLKICWGFFKKLVIADNVGVIANKVFALSDPTFPILWAGVFAFAIQIYADFSAYTDIARGTCRWLGFELPENFDHPYLARSPSDFWRRWHISLSTWFRDYVYVPLGGSRGGELQWARNILVTFLLSGLWHGAAWNYVLWGLYHGLLLIVTRARAMMKPLRVATGVDPRAVGDSPGPWPQLQMFRPLLVAAQTLGMFVLTLIGWLIFRETELSALVRDFTLSPLGAPGLDYQVGLYLFLLALLYSLPLWVQSIWVEAGRDATGQRQPAAHTATWGEIALQGAACGAALAAVLVFRSTTSLDFIYFQF